MKRERLVELLEEATVDCYNEEEEFCGVLVALSEGIRFPLHATALGEPVEVLRLDEKGSGLGKGVLAWVRKGEREYRVALSELEFVDPDTASGEWLEVYRYWLDG
jgi:hypothetical protein